MLILFAICWLVIGILVTLLVATLSSITPQLKKDDPKQHTALRATALVDILVMLGLVLLSIRFAPC